MAKITDLDDVVLTFSAGDLGVDADLFIDTVTPAIQMAPGFTIDAADGISEQCVYSSLYFFWQYRIKYQFDTGVTPMPPAGQLRFDNASIAALPTFMWPKRTGQARPRVGRKCSLRLPAVKLLRCCWLTLHGTLT